MRGHLLPVSLLLLMLLLLLLRRDAPEEDPQQREALHRLGRQILGHRPPLEYLSTGQFYGRTVTKDVDV